MSKAQHPDVAAAPPVLAAVAARVDERLASLIDAETARWADVEPDLAAPVQALGQLVVGRGKRLRAAFCHCGGVAAGGAPQDPRLIDAGAAFEMLQAFAVLHDDVMDGSSTRRGRATVHQRFAAEHHHDGWRGEPRRFGEGVAILTGDLAHTYADHLIHRAAGGPIPTWDELRLEVDMGQYLDLLGTARRDTGADRARTITRYKSGKYTVERPLQIGATIIDAHNEVGGALSAYGDPVGEAFQLRDDVLDVFGDAELLGKPTGGDLREGKPTPLLAATIERCGPDEALLAGVGDPDLGPGEVAAIADVMITCGARGEIEARIASLAEVAIDAIGDAGLDPDITETLIGLARYVATRSH